MRLKPHDEMVGRVARALGCQSGGEMCDGDEMRHPEKCEACLAAAHAAIAAMREPTDKMVEAAICLPLTRPEGDYNVYLDLSETEVLVVWKAMINVVLTKENSDPLVS